MSFEEAERIELDLGGTLSPPLSEENGVSRSQLLKTAKRLETTLEGLLSPNAKSGFVRMLFKERGLDQLEVVRTTLATLGLRDWVHIGIGGSSLGSEMIFQGLAHPNHNELSDERRTGPRIHFIDNVDPSSFSGLLDVLDLNKTAVHVVSKSGRTLETLAIFDLVRQTYEAKKVSWKDRCVITSGKGRLKDIALANGTFWNDFPENVGGRFSALAPGSLLTPFMAGVNVEAVVSGARRQLDELIDCNPERNLAAMGAVAAYRLLEKGKNIHVLMPYGDRLEAFGRWYLQLFAESLGKKLKTTSAKNASISPFNARGATDQHSQLQLFLEGKNDKLVSFIQIEEMDESFLLSGMEPREDLKGLKLSDLFKQAQRGTALALTEADCPTMSWVLPKLNEKSLGAMTLVFELLVSYLAELLEVDAYDQPAVERGKSNTNALLGLEGSVSVNRVVIPEWLI